ncbi:DUF4102 domain-containing protein [Sneathiella chungangensis]|uniref:DUF4102 domain-containing protein n=1 Tax=Sneathiella chungangensis TaxID=1418234 RepID=A0A845MJU5_9PROT|nr:integrase arm-type DNA-binding domain-containing protein [Sneathiella chungangensis]MZR23902.1 DUF4102 domain-containing protein [Sneathiella chungangensis]
MAHLTKRQIDTTLANATTEIRLWDDDPRGLGLRIKPGGTGTFFVQYRSPVTYKKVRFSFGQYGRLTIVQARDKAKRLFENISKGIDPAIEKRLAKQTAETAARMAEFCDDYMHDARMGIVTYRGKAKKASTLAIDSGRIERHIKPLLGNKFVRDITTKDIEKAMHDIRLGKTAVDVKTGFRGRAIVKGGSGTAARTITLLGSIFSYAVKQGLRDDNPVRGVEIPKDGKRARILSPDEYKALGDAMADFENSGANPIAIRAYRALALSGCRRGEIFGLKKSEVDPHSSCLRLEDTKTGQQVRPVGRLVIECVSQSHIDQNSVYVFPASSGDGHLKDAKLFGRICAAAKLNDVTLHTLRHSFASVALELEYSEMTVGGLLGHRVNSITSLYAHHVDKALVAAADRVSAFIAARMEGNEAKGADVIELHNRR